MPAVMPGAPPSDLVAGVVAPHPLPQPDAPEGGAGQGQPPLPPYKDGDLCSEAQPMACYFPGCKYKGTSWGKLFKHVTNPAKAGGHAQSSKVLNGTFLHKAGSAELNMGRRQKRLESKGSAAGGTPAATGGGDAQVMWAPHLCWVRCDATGQPTAPLEVWGLCTQEELDDQQGTGAICEQTSTLAKQEPAVTATTIALAEQPGEASVTQQLQVLSKQIDSLQSHVRPDPKAWMKTVPHLVLKARYEGHQGPPAKGEGVCTRAIWPKELKSDMVSLPEFWTYLEVQMNKKGTNLLEPYRCVGRVLGMVATAPGPQPTDLPSVSDTRFLVGLWLSKLHMKVMGLALMQPKYAWSMSTLEGSVCPLAFADRKHTVRSIDRFL